MPKCQECRYFFLIPENADDYEKGKGDCVREEKDDKGKYWSARPVMEGQDANKCEYYSKKIGA